MTIGFGDIYQMMGQMRDDRATVIRATRFMLLTRLRKAGIKEVSCTYDAYGDSGNWEDVTLDAGAISTTDDLTSAIGNFVWDVAYHYHAGFENNEGGYGELTWDLVADSITLDHADRIMDTQHSYHEGL